MARSSPSFIGDTLERLAKHSFSAISTNTLVIKNKS
jgi:hypothetical protein